MIERIRSPRKSRREQLRDFYRSKLTPEQIAAEAAAHAEFVRNCDPDMRKFFTAESFKPYRP